MNPIKLGHRREGTAEEVVKGIVSGSHQSELELTPDRSGWE